MPSSAVLRFNDPYEHQKSIRGAEAELFITAPGTYRAEVTRVDFHRLWLQRSRASLPHVGRYVTSKNRAVVFFLPEARQAPVHHDGAEFLPGDIGFDSLASEHYHRMPTQGQWASISLPPEDLASAGKAIAGHELSAPGASHPLRPPAHLMSRLLALHAAAAELAATVPDILAHPEVARAVEQQLLRVMVLCLTEGTAISAYASRSARVPVMQRFERVLEENRDTPLYIPEICAAIGVADRTLRLHCLEHLGMSPHRYLWLRRMHLARRALFTADPLAKTVTGIANDHGFGELGRFAVAYKKLFGESPSATLRSPAARIGGSASTSPLPILP